MKKEESGKRSGHAAPPTVSRPELLSGGSDMVFRDFIHDLLAFSERVMAVREGFGALIGLSGIQYTVLVSIAHLQSRGPVSISMVARHLHFSGAFITTVTNQLEQKRLILKSRDKADLRRLALTTTDEALELLEQLAPVQRRVNDVLFRDLDAGQFQELARLMGRMVDAGGAAVKLLEFFKQGDDAAKG